MRSKSRISLVIIKLPCKNSRMCLDCKGFTFNLETCKQISIKRIMKTWRKITSKPFSYKIHAYLVKPKEYERLFETLGSCRLARALNNFEHKGKFEPNLPEVLGIQTASFEYWIFMKNNGRQSFKQNLKHELENILNNRT